jgi:hypothetical protein
MKNIQLLILAGLFFLSSCESEKEPEPVDCNSSDLTLVLDAVTDVSGCGNPNGSIIITATGGVPPYQFKINSNAFQTANTFENLAAGNYTVTVKDDADCEASITAQVGSEGSSLAFTNIAATDAGCKTTDATITVNASGEGTLQYKLNDGSFQSGNSFSNVAAGTHNITIADDAGCEATSEVQVKNGTSYQNHVKAIITNNCAVSSCHDGSNASLPNFNTFSNVKSNASSIKTLTQNGSMPPGNRTITQEQKDLIACWVDDGALDN